MFTACLYGKGRHLWVLSHLKIDHLPPFLTISVLTLTVQGWPVEPAGPQWVTQEGGNAFGVILGVTCTNAVRSGPNSKALSEFPRGLSSQLASIGIYSLAESISYLLPGNKLSPNVATEKHKYPFFHVGGRILIQLGGWIRFSLEARLGGGGQPGPCAPLTVGRARLPTPMPAVWLLAGGLCCSLQGYLKI